MYLTETEKMKFLNSLAYLIFSPVKQSPDDDEDLSWETHSALSKVK